MDIGFFIRLAPFFELFGNIAPYVVFVLWMIVLLLFRKKIKNKWIAEILLIISLVVFWGLKEPFTWNLKNYCDMYQYPSALSFRSIEPFFIFPIKLLNHFSNSCMLLFVWYQFFTIFFINLAIKNLFPKSYGFSFSLYLMIPTFFLNSFGIEIRQILAIAILLYALSLLLKGKLKKSLIFFALAVVSYYSAIFAVIVIFISYVLFNKLFKNKKNFTLAVVGFLILITLLLPYGSIDLGALFSIFPVAKYQQYLLQISPVSFLELLIYNLLAFIALFVALKSKEAKRENSLFFVFNRCFDV